MEIKVEIQDKALGINLRPILGNRGAYVDSFYLESLPSIKVGDILHVVGTTNVSEERIEDIHRVLKKLKRPILLTFRRYGSSVDLATIAFSVKPYSVIGDKSQVASLEELMASPHYDVWIRKFLKSSRVYFGDKEDYALFVKLQELHMTLTSLSNAFTEELISSLSLHQLLLHVYKQLTDVYQQNDVVFPFPSPEGVSVQGLVECLREYLSILYLRGVNTIIDQLLSPSYCYKQHMNAYYFRSLHQQHFIVRSLISILVHPSDRLYLYLFLYKYPLLTHLMHKYCADPIEETCLEILITMLQHNLVVKFYASEYYQLCLENWHSKQTKNSSGNFDNSSEPAAVWTQYLPRTCSLVYPTHSNAQPSIVHSLASLQKSFIKGSVRKLEWELSTTDSSRTIQLVVLEQDLVVSDQCRHQLQELLVEHFASLQPGHASTFLLTSLPFGRNHRSLCIMDITRLEDQSALLVNNPPSQLSDEAVSPGDTKRPAVLSASDVLNAVQPSFGYLAALTSQANKSLLATFKRQLPTLYPWMRTRPDLEGATTNSSPEITHSSSATTSTTDSIEIHDSSVPQSRLPVNDHMDRFSSSMSTSVRLHGNLYIVEDVEEAPRSYLIAADIPRELYAYVGSLTHECLLELLRPHQLCLLLQALLLERKIIILIPNVQLCEFPMMLADFLCSLCRPIAWQHVFAPMVSSSTAKQLLGCPAPYILGCTTSVYQDYLHEQNIARVEDSVTIRLNTNGLCIDVDNNDKLLSNEKSDWLFRHMQAILQPAFSHFCSIKSAIANDLLHPLETTAYPATVVTLPTCTDQPCLSKLQRVVGVCNYFVECLLHGSTFCRFAVSTQKNRGCNRSDVLRSRRRSVASASESFGEGVISDTKDALDEPPNCVDAGIHELECGDHELNPNVEEISSFTAIHVEEQDLVDKPPVEEACESPSQESQAVEQCLLFNERMFLDVKLLHHGMNPGLGFSEDFVKSFLRSQCLAVYLASC